MSPFRTDLPAPPITDEALIAGALEGSKRALETLLKRHQDYIYNISLRLFLDPDDALDATQEVLIKIVTGLKTFNGQSQFRTWHLGLPHCGQSFSEFTHAPVRKAV